MNIPSLPSDSLYKFISFFGMSLTLLCYYFLFSESKNLDQQIIELNAKSREIRMQDSLLWEGAKEIQSEAEYISRRFGVKNPFLATDTSYTWTMTYKGLKAEESLSDTIKSLVNQFKIKLNLLAQKRIESDTNEYLINELVNDYNKNDLIFGILSIIGGGICFVGFRLWYIHVQRPNDKKTQRELLLIPPITTHCQSCRANFEYYENKRGTETDGTINNFFCARCYEKGQFTQPHITLAEMKESVAGELRSKGYKEHEVDEIVSRIKKLQRWNKKSSY